MSSSKVGGKGGKTEAVYYLKRATSYTSGSEDKVVVMVPEDLTAEVQVQKVSVQVAVELPQLYWKEMEIKRH